MNELKRLLLTYGSYSVIATVFEIEKKMAEECYKNNKGAIIHQDIKILEECAEKLKRLHPLRDFQRIINE